MRFLELLEYNQQITKQKFGDALLQRWYKEDGTELSPSKTQDDKDSDEVMMKFMFSNIENADPTPNKQYVLWLIRFYLANDLKFEDLVSTTAEFLHRFHTLKVKRRLPVEIVDIGRIKTLIDYDRAENIVDDLYNNLEGNKPELEKGEIQEVIETDEVRVITPEDQLAACYYGQGTKWCTAATRGKNYFDNYNKNGSLYILIPKKAKHIGEKYQIHFQSSSFMNEKDETIGLGGIIDRFPSLKEWIKSFKQTISTSHWNIVQLMDDDVWNKLIDDIEKYALRETEYEFHSLKDYFLLANDDEFLKDALARVKKYFDLLRTRRNLNMNNTYTYDGELFSDYILKYIGTTLSKGRRMDTQDGVSTGDWPVGWVAEDIENTHIDFSNDISASSDDQPSISGYKIWWLDDEIGQVEYNFNEKTRWNLYND